jgi:hypothetical protein
MRNKQKYIKVNKAVNNFLSYDEKFPTERADKTFLSTAMVIGFLTRGGLSDFA